MARAICDKDYNLLVNCEVTKFHPELLEVITKYPKIELEELEVKSIDEYNFFKNVFSRVRSEAISEWKGALEQDIKLVEKSKKIRCDICGTKIIKVCTIRNEKNGKKLNIGTECNKRFKFFNDKDVELYLKKQQEIRKINKINTNIPNLIKIMSDWKRFLDNEELYIIEKVSSEYLDVGEKIKKIYMEYTKNNVSQKREDTIIVEINELIQRGMILKEDIKKYIKNNKNNLLCPTKRMIESLKYTNCKEIGVEWLEKDEIIKLRTLYRFRDVNFANKVVHIFNKELNVYGAKIIETTRISKSNLGYNIVFNINRYCKFYYEYDYMCKLFGASITNEEENIEIFNKEDFIRTGLLIDEESIEYGLNLIENKLKYKNIEFVEYYHRFEEAIWRVFKNDSDKAKYYYKTNVDKIKIALKELMLSLNKYSDKEVFEIIKKYSEIIHNKDAEKLIEERSRI